jgi:hypothetical protein
MKHANRSRWAAISALVALGWWLVTLIGLHLLASNQYDPITQTISHLVYDLHGVFLGITLVPFGIGMIALGLGLLWAVRHAIVSPLLIAVAGALWILAGVIPTGPDGTFDVDGGGATALIHDTAALIAFLLIMGAMFALGRRFRQDDRWCSFGRPTLIWALAAVATFVVFVALGDDLLGLTQRVFVAVWASWLIAASLRLLAVASAEAAVSHGERV